MNATTDTVLNARVPATTLDALRLLASPADDTFTRETTFGELLAWAEAGFVFPLPCGPNSSHRVQMHPLTFALTVPDTAREEAETAHFLHSLSEGGIPPCQEAEGVLAHWAGENPPRWVAPTVEQAERLRAVRLVARTVQYLDAGVDPIRYREWVELGALPSTPLRLRKVARHYGKDLADWFDLMVASIPRSLHSTDLPGTPAVLRAEKMEMDMEAWLVSRLRQEEIAEARRKESRDRWKADRKRQALSRARRREGHRREGRQQ